MAKLSERDDFLKNQWDKYPSSNGLGKRGRVLAIEKSRIRLTDGKVLQTKSLKNWNQIKGVLIPGDIIGVQKNGTCLLLTPWRAKDAATLSVAWIEQIEKKIERQKKWNSFVSAVADFFSDRNFLSVQTPTLVDNPGPEPTIDTFKTEFKLGRAKSTKHLITSPELHLKKILSDSLLPVFEITKVYRNNENSAKHKPEFWMLEWYRPFANLEQIETDVKELILYLVKSLKVKSKTLKFSKTSFQKILKDKYGYHFQPDTNSDELKTWLKERKIYFSDSMSLDDLFTLVNIELIETSLDSRHIVFLNNYPPYAAALAKLDKEGWAQRFEVYWKGIELGNAFHELNDPEIQEQRLVEDNKKKLSNGLESLPMDSEFIESLKRGMPPSSGISIGLDRLFMVLFNEDDIKNLTWF